MLTWHKDASLKMLNTFGMEVNADWLVMISGQEDLLELIQDERWKTLPRLILGGEAIFYSRKMLRVWWPGWSLKELH